MLGLAQIIYAAWPARKSSHDTILKYKKNSSHIFKSETKNVVWVRTKFDIYVFIMMSLWKKVIFYIQC